MTDEAQDPELIEESTLGTVWSEHRDPNEPKPWDEHVTVERAVWTDRTFYMLSCRRGAEVETSDLNRDGWLQLRALCDQVIADMDAPQREAR